MSTTDPKRRALGKGLEALLPAKPASGLSLAASAAADSPVPSGKALEIPVAHIERNPFQTRTQFDEDKLAELTASVAASGVVQPIVVRPLPVTHDGPHGGPPRYQLIMGERRWIASQRANKATIPAIVREVSDVQAMEMTIIENLQRADLNPMEQARAFHRLSQEFKLTQEQVATRTGKDRASVANFLRLLKLPAATQAHVEAGELSFGHARALLALESYESIVAVSQKILALNLSVRGTENYITNLLHPEKKIAKDAKPAPKTDPNVREAEAQIRSHLGLKVIIEDKGGRGRVIIEYSGIDDYETLIAALGA